jgi:hypothetical protein
MKAELMGKIVSTVRTDTGVDVSLEFSGSNDHKSIDARKTTMKAVLSLKSLVADELKLGSWITVRITDEFPPK